MLHAVCLGAVPSACGLPTCCCIPVFCSGAGQHQHQVLRGPAPVQCACWQCAPWRSAVPGGSVPNRTPIPQHTTLPSPAAGRQPEPPFYNFPQLWEDAALRDRLEQLQSYAELKAFVEGWVEGELPDRLAALEQGRWAALGR